MLCCATFLFLSILPGRGVVGIHVRVCLGRHDHSSARCRMTDGLVLMGATAVSCTEADNKHHTQPLRRQGRSVPTISALLVAIHVLGPLPVTPCRSPYDFSFFFVRG